MCRTGHISGQEPRCHGGKYSSWVLPNPIGARLSQKVVQNDGNDRILHIPQKECWQKQMRHYCGDAIALIAHNMYGPHAQLSQLVLGPTECTNNSS
jgi:hypothetical protein